MNRDSFDLLYRAHSLSREEMNRRGSELASQVLAAGKKLFGQVKVVSPRLGPQFATDESTRTVRARTAADCRQTGISVSDAHGNTTIRLLSVIHTCALIDELTRASAAVMLEQFRIGRVRVAAEAVPLLNQAYVGLRDEAMAIANGRPFPYGAELQERLARWRNGFHSESDQRRQVHVRMSCRHDRIEIRLAGRRTAPRLPISIPHAYSLLQEVERSLAEIRSRDETLELTGPGGP